MTVLTALDQTLELFFHNSYELFYLSQQLCLFRVDQYQFSGQVEDLHLDLCLLLGEVLGHLPEDIRGHFGDPVRVLSQDPEDGGPGRWHLDGVQQLGHVDDDLLVLSGLGLEEFLDDHN